MHQPAALLVLPSGKDVDSTQTTQLVMRSVEDLALAERVGRALRATGYGPLRELTVTVQDRVVTLEGRVATYYLKQVAHAAALEVAGMERVCNNNLEVCRPR